MGGAVTLVFREIDIEQQEELPDSDDHSSISAVGGALVDVPTAIESPANDDRQEGPSELSKPANIRESQQPRQAQDETNTLLPQGQPLRDESITESEGENRSRGEAEENRAQEPSPNVILGLVLLLLCCCLSLLAFLVYLGGDWYLRQFGLVP
jgi:hypothetical protein